MSHSAPQGTTTGTRSGTGTGADPTAVRMVVLGAVIAILAPLGGFLGGTVSGTAQVGTDLDPLVIWLMTGLFIGGAGAVLACLGGIRWHRIYRAGQDV